MHWWYLPDSYDEWISAKVAPADVAPEKEAQGSEPLRVYVRWLTDSEHFNEWMNPLDFEWEEPAVAAANAAAAAARAAAAAEEEARRRAADMVPLPHEAEKIRKVRIILSIRVP